MDREKKVRRVRRIVVENGLNKDMQTKLVILFGVVLLAFVGLSIRLISITIDIETPDTVSLKEKLGDRDDIDLVIDGGNDSIDYSMIDDGKKVVEVINVTAPRIYAGEWEVNLPISISLD